MDGWDLAPGELSRETRVSVAERQAMTDELARLRAEVARLIAAWPTGSECKNVYIKGCNRWSCFAGQDYPTREAAVRAAAGLDAGDAKEGE
jgi:hypothetical protein